MKWIWHLFRQDDDLERRFSGQLQGEIPEFMMTKHWIVLLPFVFKIIIVGILVLLFDFYFLPTLEMDQTLVVLVHFLILSLIVHISVIRFINYFLGVVLVTNFRIFKKDHTLFFKRDQETMNLQGIQDISYHQHGLIQRVFGFGEIRILGMADDIHFHLDHVPHVSKYCNVIGHIFRNHVHRNLPSDTSLTEQRPIVTRAVEDINPTDRTLFPYPGMKEE